MNYRLADWILIALFSAGIALVTAIVHDRPRPVELPACSVTDPRVGCNHVAIEE